MSKAFSLTEHLAALSNGLGLQDVIARRPDPREVLGWTPKNDCAFVLPLIETDRTKSGAIILASTSREKPQKGVVIAVGAGMWDDEQKRLFPVEVEVGDLITYGKYSGEVFEIGSENPIEVFIMKNIEIKARCRAGSYQLTEHLVGEGSPAERFVYHETHLRCEHCPEEKSALIEEERARLVKETNAGLNDTNAEPPASATAKD